MTLQPLFDRVIVKPIKKEQNTSLLLPSNEEEKMVIAEVISVGNGVNNDGKPVEMMVQKGDKIMFVRFVAHEIECDGTKLLILSQNDILAKYV